MNLKELKRLINEEVKRYKIKEDDLLPDEETETDPTGQVGKFVRSKQDPEVTPPIIPKGVMKVASSPPEETDELPPELQTDDDGFEGFKSGLIFPDPREFMTNPEQIDAFTRKYMPSEEPEEETGEPTVGLRKPKNPEKTVNIRRGNLQQESKIKIRIK